MKETNEKETKQLTEEEAEKVVGGGGGRWKWITCTQVGCRAVFKATWIIENGLRFTYCPECGRKIYWGVDSLMKH